MRVQVAAAAWGDRAKQEWYRNQLRYHSDHHLFLRLALDLFTAALRLRSW